MNLDNNFKQQVATALLNARQNFSGSDSQFANIYTINKSVFSRLKNGEIEGVLSNEKWISIAAKLDISLEKKDWKIARTVVFEMVEEAIQMCKEDSMALWLTDLTDIGKTQTAKYLSQTLKNCFYIDCSQCKTKQAFVRTIAQAVGIDSKGKYNDVKASLKMAINLMAAQGEKPVIILDECGDLEYPAFLEIKELWNGTEDNCGWLGMGADGLQAKIKKGIQSKKVGYRELFRRFGANFQNIVPVGSEQKQRFYYQLAADVLTANGALKADLHKLIVKCMVKDEDGHYYVLTRAKQIMKDYKRGTLA